MDKLFTLLWILVGIGAFVFRMVKKMQETTDRESQERPVRPGGAVPGLPAASFQELLQQMQARNAAPGNRPAPATAPPAPLVPRTLGGRLLPREVARPARSQERPLAKALSLEAPATSRTANAAAPLARRASALPRASTETPAADFRPGAARSAIPVGETVRQLLRQPESVRAAVVLSEILRRTPFL